MQGIYMTYCLLREYSVGGHIRGEDAITARSGCNVTYLIIDSPLARPAVAALQHRLPLYTYICVYVHIVCCYVRCM